MVLVSVDLEVGVTLKRFFVVGEQPHRVVGFQPVRFDGGVNLRFHLTNQFALVPLHHGENFTDGGAFDGFLDVPSGLLVFIEEYMGFVDSSEKVVQIAHDVLVGAHQEDADVVRGPVQTVEGKRILDVAEIDELRDFSVGIASDVDQGGVPFGEPVEVIDGHDWEELPERPVIEKRLEHGEVADVLVAEGHFEFLHFVGDELHPFAEFDDAVGDFPKHLFDAGFAIEIEEPEVEH
ncbi:MAG: hypothetical protein RIS92_3022 [Verrucomicrobiota bacterium]